MNKNLKIGLIVGGILAVGVAAYFYFRKKNVVSRADEGKITGSQIENLGTKALETLGAAKAEKQAAKTERQQGRLDLKTQKLAARTARKIKRGKLSVADLSAAKSGLASQPTA